MKFLLRPNSSYPEALEFARRLETYLLGAGQTVTRDPEGGADMAVIIGGDGTILQAARELQGKGMPLWSVNYGHLGYLAECEPGDAFPAVDQILRGDYRTEQRVLLEGRLEGHAPFFCLNEAVIHRSGYARTLGFTIAIDGTEIARLSGDGLLLSTPTGSTGYNLSAGGPVLLPTARELVITPICAHAAVSAPVVVPDGHEVTVRLHIAQAAENSQDTPRLSIDSCEAVALQGDETLRFRVSEQRVTFVKTGSVSFYQRLQNKLKA